MIYLYILLSIIAIMLFHIFISKYKYQTTRAKRIHDRNVEFEHFKRHNIEDLIVFVGDSITEQFKVNEYFMDRFVINRGVSGNYTYEVLERLDTVISQNPKIIVLCIGTNDMSRKDISVEEAFQTMNEIINRIQDELPNTKLILHSLYPINTSSNSLIDKKTQKKRGYYPQKVYQFNKLLKNRYATSNVTYIDTSRMMTDEDGNLMLDYTIDGVHLSHKGYDYVSGILRKQFNQILSNKDNKKR